MSIQIQRYRNRLSGPLLDRIDIQVEVPPVRVEDIERAQPGENSAKIRKRVNAARLIQNQHFAENPLVHCNALMGSRLLQTYCRLDSDSNRLLHRAVDRLGLSARPITES